MWSGYYNTIGNRNIYLGYKAGFYQVSSDKLIIDNQDRGSSTNEDTKALIVGIMASTPANQSLTINAAQINMNYLPTDSTGLPSNRLWNNNGVISIVP
jgi:hypothetical protein